MMEPWEDPNGIWKSKSAFFSYIRGQLRRAWTHYPIAKKFKDKACRPNRRRGRAKFVGECASCNATMAKSHLQIDHIIPAGSITSWETSGDFLRGLFTTSDNMRLLCKKCHNMVTQMERFQCSKEEAIIRSKVVAFAKESPENQKTTLISNECPEHLIKNAKSRRAAYHQFLSTGTFDGL